MKKNQLKPLTMDYLTSHRFALQKYEGMHTKHTCPACGRKRCFTLYVDEYGTPLADNVGRCDHESSCGYIKTPKEYFAEHPDVEARLMESNSRCNSPQRPKPQPPPRREIYTIPEDIVARTVRPNFPSVFTSGLCDLLSPADVRSLVEEYRLGVTKARDVIFYQIDIEGRCRTGKVMAYRPDLHRVKDAEGNGRITWIHSLMKEKGDLPKEWELTQCLFGEHLLRRYPEKEVRVVESEKTAVICAGFMPGYTWLATGGKSQFNARMDVLRGRKVVLFPDVDGYDLWREKAAQRRDLSLVVSDYLERNATEQDRRDKIDIADLLIRWKKDIIAREIDTCYYSDIDPTTLDIVRRSLGRQAGQAIDLIREFGLVAKVAPQYACLVSKVE